MLYIRFLAFHKVSTNPCAHPAISAGTRRPNLHHFLPTSTYPLYSGTSRMDIHIAFYRRLRKEARSHIRVVREITNRVPFFVSRTTYLFWGSDGSKRSLFPMLNSGTSSAHLAKVSISNLQPTFEFPTNKKLISYVYSVIRHQFAAIAT